VMDFTPPTGFLMDNLPFKIEPDEVPEPCDGGDSTTSLKLLAAKATVNLADESGYLLFTAAHIGDSVTEQTFIDAKGDANTMDSFNQTLLFSAAGGGHIAIVHSRG